jgi:hypothetical protein
MTARLRAVNLGPPRIAISQQVGLERGTVGPRIHGLNELRFVWR